MQSKISVLMPVYNGADFLKETIESVCNQTFKNWEFIIVNDGSVDKSEDIILEFARKDNRIVYIKNETNMGVAKSLNRGLDIADGVYIARVDADDPCFPQRFELQVGYLDEHPEIGVLGSAFILEDPKESRVVFQRHRRNDEIKAGFFTGNDLAHSTLMIRNSILKDNGLYYDSSYKLEDFELWTRVMKYTKLANMKQVLTKHRVYDSSVCKVMGDEFYINCQRIVRKMLSSELHIQIEKYSSVHFFTTNVNLAHWIKDERDTYIAEEFRLLCELETANDKYQFADRFIFNQVLRQKWNWVINSLDLDRNLRGLLPVFSDNRRGGFRFRFIADMMEKGAIKDETISNEEIMNIIKLSVQNKINRRAINQEKVIVYGLGKMCYDYFKVNEPIPDNIMAFTDQEWDLAGNSVFGRPVISPNDLGSIDYTCIAVTSIKFYQEIRGQLIGRYGVSPGRICLISELF